MNIAAILAGGKGLRMGGDMPKQFIEIEGKPLIAYTIEKFQNHPETDAIYLVCLKEYVKELQDITKRYHFTKVKEILAGGETRRDSSRIATEAAERDFGPEDILLIHDAARPNVSAEIISENIRLASNIGACNTVIPSQDTILISKDGKMLSSYTNRDEMFLVQTPQSFKISVISRAHKEFKGAEVTDDCALAARLGYEVGLVIGDKKNVKITTEEDLAFLY